MSSSLRTVIVLGVATVFLKGCIFSPTVTDPGGGGPGSYLAPTSPTNIISNLAEAYRRKEIEEYTKLLAPEFIFYFQPGDLDLIEGDSWSRDQDSTGTAGLFGTPLVGEIRIDLPHGPAEKPSETRFDPDVLTVRISPTKLQVDQVSGENQGVTLQVDGDYQDMYFRPGHAEAGEDTTRWYIIEWRDSPSTAVAAPGTVQPAGSEAPGESTSASMPAPLERVTWGEMLQRMSRE